MALPSERREFLLLREISGPHCRGQLRHPRFFFGEKRIAQGDEVRLGFVEALSKLGDCLVGLPPPPRRCGDSAAPPPSKVADDPQEPFERSLHLGCRAMEHLDRRQVEVLEVAVEARVAAHRDEGVKHIGQSALDRALVGQGARIGFIPMGAVVIELTYVEYAGCRGRGMEESESIFAIDSHGCEFLMRCDRSCRGLQGEQAASWPGLHRRAQRPKRSGGGQGGDCIGLAACRT